MKIIQRHSRLRVTARTVLAAGLYFSAGLLLMCPASLGAQEPKIIWSGQEKPIADQIGGLRALPGEVRAQGRKTPAIEIRQFPATPHKLRLAKHPAMLST